MKSFVKNDLSYVNAMRFTDKNNLPHMVSLCEEIFGKIYKVPSDRLGPTKNSFYAINIENMWERVNIGDWIIKEVDKHYVVNDSVFKLMFKEV